jgi:prepilin-type N-terminal cleavage/methylation domain-containing protein
MQSEQCKLKSEREPCGILHFAFCTLRLRRAFTLVELLVVIAIISAVTLATVPMILPALDSRRIRESARIVSTQFASAQSEAIAKGRSVGVWIERLSADPTASMDLFLCETPQPYSGDTSSSMVQVAVTAGTPVNNVVTTPGGPPQTVTPYTGKFAFAGDSGWVGLMRPGDMIRFSFRGPWYRILQGSTALDANGYFQASQTTFDIEPVDQSSFVYNYSSSPATKVTPVFSCLPPAAVSGWSSAFQINFQPIKSASGPVQLPAGAVVDLPSSGIAGGQLFTTAGITQQQFSDTTSSPNGKGNRLPIIVTFDRTGALEYLYVRGPVTAGQVQLQRVKLTDPVYFLIGKREKLATLTSNPAEQNLTDLENIWVSLNPQTGLVTTAEVAAIPTGSTTPLHDARAYAQAAQTMGGR